MTNKAYREHEQERNDVIKYVRGTSRDPMFEVKGLSYSYTRPGIYKSAGKELVFTELSFALFAGETLAVIGESGAGTSTLALLLAGLLPPGAGSIALDGSAKTAMPTGRYSRAVQLASHDWALPPRQKAWQIVSDPLAVRTTMTVAERRAAATELLTQLGFAQGLEERTPAQLSHEARQLVALARALILKPKILILDRVTAALSPSATARVLNLLVALQQKTGLSIIFIAHDLAVVHHISDRAMVLHEGAIVEYDATANVLHRPQHAFTHRLTRDQPRPL